MSGFVGQWLAAFVVTQAAEVPIYTLAQEERPMWQRLLVAFGASAITHPIVWFVLYEPLLPIVGYTPYLLIAETFAWGVEALWLRGWGVDRPALWSLTANAASVALGSLLRVLELM